MLIENNIMDEVQKNTIHLNNLSKKCGFANSLVGEQKITTISISEWTEPKAAQIPVTVTTGILIAIVT